MVCLEVLQIFIMCPLFYAFTDDRSMCNKKILLRQWFYTLDVNLILTQAFDRSPAYASIKDVLQNLNDDEVNSYINK